MYSALGGYAFNIFISPDFSPLPCRVTGSVLSGNAGLQSIIAWLKSNSSMLNYNFISIIHLTLSSKSGSVRCDIIISTTVTRSYQNRLEMKTTAGAHASYFSWGRGWERWNSICSAWWLRGSTSPYPAMLPLCPVRSYACWHVMEKQWGPEKPRQPFGSRDAYLEVERKCLPLKCPCVSSRVSL